MLQELLSVAAAARSVQLVSRWTAWIEGLEARVCAWLRRMFALPQPAVGCTRQGGVHAARTIEPVEDERAALHALLLSPEGVAPRTLFNKLARVLPAVEEVLSKAKGEDESLRNHEAARRTTPTTDPSDALVLAGKQALQRSNPGALDALAEWKQVEGDIECGTRNHLGVPLDTIHDIASEKLTTRDCAELEVEATSFVRSLGYANDKTASLLGENEKVLKAVYDAPQIGGLTDVDLYALREACGTLQHQTATANHATLELRKLQVSQRNKTIKAFAQRARASEDWEDVEAACERWCVGKTPRWRADVEEKSRVAQAAVDQLRATTAEMHASIAALGIRFLRTEAYDEEARERQSITMTMHREPCSDVLSGTSTPGLVERLMCVLHAETEDPLPAARAKRDRKAADLLQYTADLQHAEAGGTAEAMDTTGDGVLAEVLAALTGAPDINNMDRDTALRILGVKRPDPKLIASAYRARMLCLHPDKGSCTSEDAERAYHAVVKAKERVYLPSIVEDRPMPVIMTNALAAQRNVAKKKQTHELQCAWNSALNLSALTPLHRAILKNVTAILAFKVLTKEQQYKDRCLQVFFEAEVRNPAGGDPLTILLPPDPAFIVDKVMPSHKARQQLLHTSYTRIVREYLKDRARARTLVNKTNDTLGRCWGSVEVAMDRWMTAAAKV